MPQPTTISLEVAAEIRARKGADLSARSLADQTGIPLTTLRRYLSGASPFNIIDLERVCRVLGTTVSEVVAAADKAA